MSDVEDFDGLRENLRLLSEIAANSINTIKMIGDQNMALTCAVVVLSASIKSHGINISEELIVESIKNLRENSGLNPPRDKLIRDLLFGDPLSAPVVPDFTVIRGGKDDPARE